MKTTAVKKGTTSAKRSQWHCAYSAMMFRKDGADRCSKDRDVELPHACVMHADRIRELLVSS